MRFSRRQIELRRPDTLHESLSARRKSLWIFGTRNKNCFGFVIGGSRIYILFVLDKQTSKQQKLKIHCRLPELPARNHDEQCCLASRNGFACLCLFVRCLLAGWLLLVCVRFKDDLETQILLVFGIFGLIWVHPCEPRQRRSDIVLLFPFSPFYFADQLGS